MSGNPSLQIASPALEQVDLPFLKQHDIRLSFLRLDQIHPSLHGNKWFKLRLNLEAMRAFGKDRLLSFGGAWSNHLVAVASAGKLMDFETIGVVRGEISDGHNPVLNYLREQGMQLHAVTRSQYREKTRASFVHKLKQRFGDFYLLPEGGSNAPGVKGCAEIVDFLQWQDMSRPGLVAVACGTGATLAGLILGLATKQSAKRVLGVSVLKAPGYLGGEVRGWLDHFSAQDDALASAIEQIPWEISDDYHCGGYARSDPGLRNFLDCWADSSNIPLEPVYTGKLVYGLQESIRSQAIQPGTEIIAIHTGGLKFQKD